VSEQHDEYRKPDGAQSVHTIRVGDTELSYAAEADWLVLRTDERPVAEIFHVYYAVDDDRHRPLTIVFNGGPGAASAYLHMGAVGPRRAVFSANGTPCAPPVAIVDNAESWLEFTDLVFVDPVGTGFSRAIRAGDDKEQADPAKEFWKIERDLNALGEFIAGFLSLKHRWDAPVFIAGESYGGFRAAKLARLAQERFGVGINGVILISPALEFALLDPSDYDILPWIDVLPSMAAAAAHHRRAGAFSDPSDVTAVLAAAESLATTVAPSLLLAGDALAPRETRRIASRIAAHIGLDPRSVERCLGRVTPRRFARELLQDQGLVCGLYDATVTVNDPYPDRDTYAGPDPTLRSIERVFSAAINTHLRRTLSLATDRDYRLLSMDVNKGWQVDIERHAMSSQIGATDDLRYGMSLNPHLKVRISHGVYDLVTPYYSSSRLARLMRLSDAARDNLSLRHYPGGHMFYTWDSTRRDFTSDIRAFYSDALSRSDHPS
jgi:carboxypeptidase C (cathepsin A)